MSAKKTPAKPTRKRGTPQKPVKPRWVKGQSGNPAGARNSKKFTTLLSQAIKDNLAKAIPGQKQSYAEAIGSIAVRAVHKRIKADLAAGELSRECLSFMEEFMNRSEGRVPQAVTFPELAKLLEGKTPEELERFAATGQFLTESTGPADPA